MMRSLYSGVAGLRTHQTKMDVIGNNIANVNTTSFKSQSITFSDLMYQTTQTASGATETKGGVNARQIGLGAKSGAINTAITSQGATQTTNNPFDIMITGESFFVVNNGNQNLYTRDGSFYIDGAGNLAMQSNGYFVMGWTAQEDTETGEITINKNGGLSQLQIMSAANSTYSPASTTATLFSGNIDDNDKNVLSDDGKTITLEFYDNKGYLYTGKFTLKDTGTDHLFALSLTDIIDSDGNSLGSDLLKNVTFGDVDSDTNTVQYSPKSGYSFEVDSTGTVYTINAPDGDVKYANVPNNSNGTNSLSDLMSTSSKKYAGVLNNVYNISSDDETNYGANATYKIITDTTSANYGSLVITYTSTDVSSETYNGTNYKFTSSPKDKYFLNTSNNEAYAVPGGSGSSGEVFNDGNNYLQTVFGLDDSVYATSDYNYTYSSNTITFYRNVDLATTTTKVAYNSATLADNMQYFSGAEAALNNWTGGGANRSNANVTYTYMGSPKTLTLYGQDYEEGTLSSQLTAEDITSEAYEALKTNYAEVASSSTMADFKTYIDSETDTDIQATAQKLYDQLKAVLTDNYSTYSTYSGVTYSSVDDFIANSSFSVSSITGTNGVTFTYPSMNLSDTYQEIGSYTVESASGTKVDSLSEAQSLRGVFNSKDSYGNTLTYGKAYGFTSLSGMEFTSTSNQYEDFLTAVYTITGSEVQSLLGNLQADTTYSISLSTDGYITITHDVEEDPIAMDSEYKLVDNGDETISFTSTNVYKDVSSEGNITDLLTTSKSSTANLLSKIYGISDEDADAYGTDGTYKISTDGTIKLTIGEHTIQLAFDPANGGLVTADGNASGKVTMNFNQNKAGLEAFGFQSNGTADQEDMAGNVTFDFSTLTNYNTNGSSTIKATKGDIKSLNTGRAVGEMNGVTVSTDGQIYATYSNGQTKLLGQIASAEFANASGLSKEGDNLYASTLNSGEATIQDITTDGGYMNTGVLEMSNVDLSAQFTEMITTQRGFQANSRIITVSDTLLEELTNLKR